VCDVGRVVAVFARDLTAEECAVVVRRGGEPQVVYGPGSVRTFERWRRVVIVDMRPFRVEVSEDNVVGRDGDMVTAHASAEGNVVDPAAAATKVVDSKNATRQILETAVRGAAKECSRSDLRNPDIESNVERTVREAVAGWGVAVSSVRLDLT
jgi:SPFH domain/Band 7 family protein